MVKKTDLGYMVPMNRLADSALHAESVVMLMVSTHRGKDDEIKATTIRTYLFGVHVIQSTV